MRPSYLVALLAYFDTTFPLELSSEHPSDVLATPDPIEMIIVKQKAHRSVKEPNWMLDYEI